MTTDTTTSAPDEGSSITEEMVCFALYSAARATTQAYRTLLEPWGLTYPQYLVLIILWADGPQTVSSLGERTQLDSGTLSPLLRRMESADLVARQRSSADERVVTVTATEHAQQLRTELADLPRQVFACSGLTDQAAARELIDTLTKLNAAMRSSAAAPSGPTTKDGSPPAQITGQN